MVSKIKFYCNALFLTFLIVVTSSIQHCFAQQSYENDQNVAALSSEQLQKVTTDLKYYDETLTASVLSYAFSGDDKWLHRYNEYESKLTSIINNLLLQKNGSNTEQFAYIHKVNQTLVTIEKEAIEAVKNNNKEYALTLINSEKYKQNKAEYLAALMGYINTIKRASQRINRVESSNDYIKFTERERKWITENKVIIGIDEWPPILFLQENTPRGLSSQTLQQVIEESGLQVEYVTGPWIDLLTQFKHGEIDLLPAKYFLESHKEFGYFSTPYFTVKELFYVKDESEQFQSTADLSNATIAIEAGFTTIDKIKALYPDINILETADTESSIQKVISGEADALLGAQLVIEGMIEKEAIKTLRVIDETPIFPSSLYLYSNKDKKILHDILVKSLDFIKKDEDKKVINNDQFVAKEPVIFSANNNNELLNLIWFVIGTVTLLAVFGAIISSLLLKTSEQELVGKFNSPRFKSMVYMGLITLSITLIIGVSFIDSYTKKRQLEAAEYDLQTLLSTTHQRLTGWIKYELAALERVGKNKELVALVEDILTVPEHPDALKSSPLQAQIRLFFKLRESEFGKIGFFIISPNKINLSSRRDSNIGATNIIQTAHPDLLKQVMQGRNVFVPTMRSEVYLQESQMIGNKAKPPTMFFAAPIVNANDEIIAIVTKRINFKGVFSGLLSTGFIGKSGETYAIDKAGLLLSNVRFENKLREIGLLDKNEHASLNIRSSAPGINLLKQKIKTSQNPNWPLTLMASQIALGKSGGSIEGYQDYRGVEVIGEWMWDEQLNIGLAAEMDMHESLEIIVVFRYAMFSILFTSLLLIFAGTLFTLKIGTRATNALTRSKTELEDLVHERTDALEASMKRTRNIIDNASDGIIVVNEEGTILEFSHAAERIFGYKTEELLNKNISLIMHRGFHRKYLDNQQNSQEKQGFYELIGFNANTLWINLEVAVSVSSIEEERLFTGIVRDATERKKIHRELKKEKLKAEEATHSLADQIKFQQLLMDSVPIPLFYKDGETRFQGFNKAYEEIFGIDSTQLIGLKVTDLDYLPEEDRRNYQAEDEEIIKQQKTIKREMQMPFADGELHDTLYWVTGFKDSKDNPAGLVGNFIDISSEKESARQMELAAKAADEANQAKADFLANMSHEIRTPMNAIIGMSYLALQTNLNRKQEDYINKIHGSADALLGIINDILDFSKIEAGKLTLEEVPFNLNETIDHLVQIISHKSQEKRLELLIDLDPELPLDLIGDSLRLGQILINLTNNSIKFTEQGEVIVSVKRVSGDDNNVTLEFCISDTGIGMTEEQLGRLFQSFSQADASTTRKYGGTGLGLTISKTLTELMQGKIWVESNYGEGSKFYFTATFGLADDNSVLAQASTKSLLGLPVLIVDDSVAAREILFTLSESLGFMPELAVSGAEALDKLTLAEKNNNPFKLVLSDWQMPNMDGIELGEKITTGDLLSTPPKFIIITAYDRDALLKKTDHIDLASAMTKPVSASTLLDTTLKIMDQEATEKNSVQSGKLDLTAVQAIAGAEILLVEDNAINQQIAVELLEMAGLIVTVANNGKIAVETIEHKVFDAVLMDLQMPIMDGYEATNEIRKDKKNASLPIIAMTANAMSGDKEKCIAAGMNEHLSKPIDPQEMYSTIARWVKPTDKPFCALQEPSVSFDNSELPSLPEFDIDSALARMAGNVTSYRKTLKKVVASESDAVQRIRAALEQNDYQGVVLAAHTLKGVTSSIGANFVVPPADQLELLFTAHIEKGTPLVETDIEMHLIECEVQLTKMVVAIENDQLTLITDDKSASFDAERVSQLLNDLHQNIEMFDSAASDTLQEIFSCIEADQLSPLATDLAAALESYDFDSAEKLVPRFEEELSNYNDHNKKSKSKKISDETLLMKLDMLSEQIENFDSSVVDTVDVLLELEFSESAYSALEKMRDSLNQYDFDAAEEQLNKIKELI